MKTQKTKQNTKRSLIWILVSSIFLGLASMSLAEEGGTWTRKADMPTARSLFSTCVVNGKIYAIGGHDGQKCLSAIEEYDPVTDTWTRKTDMPTARILDQSVSVVKGKIYAIGGWPGWGNGVPTVEMYDPETDTWTEKANMPTRRGHFPTCVVNGKIYAISGKLPPFTSAVEEYDPETDTWTRKANIPTPRARFDAAVVNGKIYAIGGYEKEGVPAWGGPILSTVEEYDPVADTWTQKADMPSARGGLSVCAVAGKIYAIGGVSGNTSFFSITEEYDPATDTWTRKADMLTARAGLGTAVVNGKIYAVGGKMGQWGGGGTRLSTVEEYNPMSDVWVEKADLPTAMSGLGTCAVNEKVYAIGGVGQGGIVLSIMVEYDPVTDKWTQKDDMPTARCALAAAAVSGRIYAIGGDPVPGIGKPLSTVEEYTPEGWRWRFAVSPQGKLSTMWGGIKHCK